MIYRALRPLLFKLDPENVHELSLKILKNIGSFSPLNQLMKGLYHSNDQPVSAFGLNFKNPIGLAAGFDKNGTAWKGLAALGFGHIEIGTVTPEPQIGNPKPRIFRLPEDKALINRMGFPSLGADYVAKQIQNRTIEDLVLGVNLGKNKETPLVEAHKDYQILIEKFSPLADYLVINISSPNTVGLRDLQSKKYLAKLLEEIQLVRDAQPKYPPMLVKLSPDLSETELKDAVEVILNHKIEGIIATNTTIARNNLISNNASENGGLSGAPLKKKSAKIVKDIYSITEGKIDIIACGGISSKEDIRENQNHGAKLFQAYTGFIYQGPNFVKSLN